MYVLTTLVCISQLSDLLCGKYTHSSEIIQHTIIDCRYPYEYDGGHIMGAINIWSKDALMERFFKDPPQCQSNTDKTRLVIVFHCEFSSKRGPDM